MPLSAEDIQKAFASLSNELQRAAEIWFQVKVLIPPSDLNKASYAFEDLWESLYGAS